LSEIRYPKPRAKAPPRRPSLSPRTLLAGAIALAAVVAGVLIAISLAGGGEDKASTPTGAVLPGAVAARSLLAGIPQDGAVLGQPAAPVTLVEYADLQCPYCAQWSLDTFPTLVNEYVRGGKLRIEFRGMAFLGPDSEKALSAVYAAGEQDRLWHVLDVLFANQAGENSGWVTDDLLAGLAPSLTGLDGELLLADADGEAVADAIARSEQQAQADGIRGTPSFLLGSTGGTLELLELTSLDAQAFRSAIDAVLAA
jgi:protein-disulfide isomerase